MEDNSSKKYFCGKLIGMKKETAEIIVENDALTHLPRLLNLYFPRSDEVLFISDINTSQAAADRIMKVMKESRYTIVRPLILDGGTSVVQADENSIETVQKVLSDHPEAVAVSVGSGTINDIVKVAAFEHSRRYICVATAASVDGYTSFGASITSKGFKHTRQCMAPVAVVADIEILRKAPYALTSAGWGDLIAKIPSCCDWILSNCVTGEVIDPSIWSLVETDLFRKAHDVDSITKQRSDAVASQFLHLANTGIAMQLSRSSRPASGAEHLISHVWEMDHLSYQGVPVLHGHKVFLGSLISTALYEYLFSLEDIVVSNRYGTQKVFQDKVRTLTEMKPYSESVYEIAMSKYREAEQLERCQKYLLSLLPQIKIQIEQRLIDFSVLRSLGKQGGLAVTLADLDIGREQAFRAIVLAQLLRNRYTILDYLSELGLLERAAERILSDSYYFG